MPHQATVPPPAPQQAAVSQPAPQKGAASASSESSPEQEKLLRTLVDSLSLPKTTLCNFDGNPLNFHSFMKSFDTVVDHTTIPDSAKLARLIECCKGRAATVLQPCTLLPPTEGYYKARKLLEDRFGDSYMISEAWINKITEGAQLRMYGRDLQDFADLTRGCLETLRAMY